MPATKALVVVRNALANNIKVVRERAGQAQVIAVLKGNAYGMGLVETAHMMRDGGINFCAVSEPSDLVKLRDSGFTDERVLMLRSTGLPSEIQTIIKRGGIATIGSHDTAVAVNRIAKNMGVVSPVQIEIDTGMGRHGFLLAEVEKVIAVFRDLRNLHVTGMFTHFCNAFRAGKAGDRAVRQQFEGFMKLVNHLKSDGLDVGMLHAANSPALFKYPYTHLDAVRIGSAFTGRVQVKSPTGLISPSYAQAPVIEIRWLEPGCTAGYGSAFKARARTRIAVVPIGYCDGFLLEKEHDVYTFVSTIRHMLRELRIWLTKKHRYVEIKGRKCKVLGSVGTLHFVCDVTERECAVGDLVNIEVNPVIAGNILPKRYV